MATRPPWEQFVDNEFEKKQAAKSPAAAKPNTPAPPAAKMPWEQYASSTTGPAPVEVQADSPVSNSTTENVLAGIGKAFTGVGRGIKQVGAEALSNLPGKTGSRFAQDAVDLRAETDEAKRLDAPLMATKAGAAGNVIGNVAATLPAAFIPGANTVLGAGLVGAGLGATQEVGANDSRLQNTALGAAAGAAGQKLIGAAGNYLTRREAGQAASGVAAQSKNELRDSIIAESQKAGYVIPPTQSGGGTVARTLEGIAGTPKIQQKASIKNSEVTNNLVKRDLGLAPDQQLTPETLSGLKAEASSRYDAIKSFPENFQATQGYIQRINQLGAEWDAAAREFPGLAKNRGLKQLQDSLNRTEITPEGSINIIKKLRSDASANLKSFDNPDKLALGRAQRDAAGAVEDLIEENLKGSGNTSLLTGYQNARKQYAKIFNVENALNEVTGNIDAKKLAQALDKGVPLSDGLRTVANFAKAFPKSSANVDTMGATTGASHFDTLGAAGLASATGNPLALAGAAARPLLQNAILSRPGQNILGGAPSYTPGALTHVAGALTNNDLIQRLTPALLSQSLINPKK
jgi:hypothetical protein